MFETIVMIIGGLIGLAVGAELLVRGAVGIAQKMGVSTLFTGLVIVGFATSMPEMVASVQAALEGSPGIAWGNIVGSNLANTLLILGVTALVAPIALSGGGRRDAVVALIATLALAGLAYSQMGAGWIGWILLAAIIAYIVWRYLNPGAAQDDDEGEDGPQSGLFAAGFFAAGLAILVFSGQILVSGAIDLATLFGVSETAIGITVVAFGTSLPELAASVAAALRGKPGLAIGNVVGSNIYNIFLIGGVTMSIAPFALPENLLGLQMGLLIVSAVILLGLLWCAKRIGRVIGSALLAIFLANVAFVLT